MLDINKTLTKAERRSEWEKERQRLESASISNATPGQSKAIRTWFIFSHLIKFMDFFLKAIGLYSRGRRNANEINVNLVDHQFEKLPDSFNGLTILHLSDLHLQERPELGKKIISMVKGYKVDLLIFTGDFTTKRLSDQDDFFVCNIVEEIISSINPSIGSFGVLGNHDHWQLASKLENAGVRLLINEAVDLKRGEDSIRLIGTDDPHYFYTPKAKEALEMAGENFSISLVHSPELFDLASKCGVDFYLCGHTHGGQICLPFGIPIITHLNAGKRFYRGKWYVNGMHGYTSTGVGTVALPLRYNVPGEIAIHFLRGKY